MKRNEPPVLDARDSESVFTELLARRPGYVPAWRPSDGSAGWALLRVFSRFMHHVIERLNQAPDKNLLAFLDMLGMSLIPAQAARVPVVFQPPPGAVDGRVPARTRVGAQIPEQPDPILFETETAIAVAAGKLVEVKTVWPARDEYADHRSEVLGGRPFTLFTPRRPVPHELYLAHDTLFAFSDGDTTVQIEFELSAPGSEALKLDWQFWDGQIWQPFRPFDPTDAAASKDGTEGLTRSGIVTLRAECGKAEKTTINGIDAYWVKANSADPLPPRADRVLPEIDRIRLRTSVTKPAVRWDVYQSEISGPLRIEGLVRLQDGSPLVGANVELVEAVPIGEFPGPDLFPDLHDPDLFSELQTDGNGRFVFSSDQIEPEGSYALNVRNEPFVRSTIRIELAQDAIQVVFVLTLGERLDRAFSDGLQLDVTKTFHPLGQVTQIGNAFYLNNEEVFSKPGARITMWVAGQPERMPREELNETRLPTPKVVWEYSDGADWKRLPVEPVDPSDPEVGQGQGPRRDPQRFIGKGSFSTIVPIDLNPTEVNGEEFRWFRTRLVDGDYGFQRTVEFEDGGPTFTLVEKIPPAVADLRLGYDYQSPWERPDHCLTYNDFQFEIHSDDVRWPGGFFLPFRPVIDATPTLYLGFDQPLPNDLVSLYLDLEESPGSKPKLVWEVWDETWQPLRVFDDTDRLDHAGIVSFVPPDITDRAQAQVGTATGSEIVLVSPSDAPKFQTGDRIVIRDENSTAQAVVRSVGVSTLLLETPLENDFNGAVLAHAALPRFGEPLDWVRVRREEDGAARQVAFRGIYLNAVWARHAQTIENEILGSGTGQPNQVVFFTQTPVLPDETIEVRELDGAIAEVELPIVRSELADLQMGDDAIRVERDPRGDRIESVYVRWKRVPHLHFSTPNDRHYVLDRARGRAVFGNDQNGRSPDIKANNVQTTYGTGGGLIGNVPADTVSQVLSAAHAAQSVTNPRPGEGGAPGETTERAKQRAPETIRHRFRAVSARDFEVSALEASPGVAFARALPNRAPNLRPAPGRVTLILVPHSHEPRPQPSFELRRRVQDFISARAPATLPADRIAAIGPTYLLVGVSARVAPVKSDEAGLVEQRVRDVVSEFLHPVTGGPDGCGWPFGNDVCLSDLAALVESAEGVDYVESLELLLDDTPQGERVAVGIDQVVAAGELRVEMLAAAS